MKGKGLKKLVLSKEDVVNLNDYDLSSMQGGLTFTVIVIAGIGINTIQATAATATSVTVYIEGKDNSFWNCPAEPISKVANADGCQIPEVVVYGSEAC